MQGESPIPEIKLYPPSAGQEVIYRTGNAPEIFYPLPIRIKGDIKAPGNFLKVRRMQSTIGTGIQGVYDARAIVRVNKKSRSIILDTDPQSEHQTHIEGTLEKSDESKLFGLNSGTIMSRDSFVKLVRFNKIFFADKAEHSNLLEKLNKLVASISYSATESSDSKGNKDQEYRRTVTTALPADFTINIPVFKGFGSFPILVEICIGVKDGRVEFWLESVQFHELVESQTDEIIEEELKAAVGLVIIYE